MTPALRRVALGITAIAVAAFAAASLGAYRPGGVTDRTLAFDELKNALNSLDARDLDATARFTAYRDGLNRADVHLRRAIRSTPVDTASIERLAAVRWETGVLAGEPDVNSVQSLVRIAAERASRVPEIQSDIGSLLYRMGAPEKAAPFMRRAVDLSPATTGRVVSLMQEAGVEPIEIAETLPQTAALMVALRAGFQQSGRLEEWLLATEELLPEYPGDLLWSYTDACLEMNAQDRLLEHIERLGVLADRSAEAKRQIAIGRLHLARKEWTLAASAAARARALSPSDRGVIEFAGQMAFVAGDFAQAAEAFREALTALALEGGRGIDRARLYRQRGQALERLGRVDDAFDEYRRAFNLLPDDPWLRQRFATAAPRTAQDTRP